MSTCWTSVAQQISAAIAHPFSIHQRRPLSGGCINQAWWVSDGSTDFFVKLNTANQLAMFAAEAAGLTALRAVAAIRVPEPICYGVAGSQAYLVLEYLPLSVKTAQAMECLGRQLAVLHNQIQPYFGWSQDNTIGSTPQLNGCFQDWLVFWRDQRLGFQLALAATKGYTGSLQRQGEKLQAKLGQLFDSYQPMPALLHGDLWNGNVGCTRTGEPIIFDPAVYYGDREADLAMTELFGGFPERFYAAYREQAPLPTEYAQRRVLYNLYHVLNHLNLFGGRYLNQAEQMLSQLLAELG